MKKNNKKQNKSTPRVTLDELFNVLSFYADEDNYLPIEDLSEIEIDDGSKARKILKRLLKEYLNKIGNGWEKII